MLLFPATCRQEISLSSDFGGSLSGALANDVIVRELWSGRFWQDSLQGLSTEEQVFALDTFMGATAEAAEHAKQDDMLTEEIGQQGV